LNKKIIGKTKKRIGLAIYANPDYYPPIINGIKLLSEEFDIILICRNQDESNLDYPDNVKVRRLGSFKTAREKEIQPGICKFWEYLIFTLWVAADFTFYRCRIIYVYDMHSLLAVFLARCLSRKTTIVYHNLDLTELGDTKGVNRLLKRTELYLSRRVDKVVFPDINRAKFFQNEAGLPELPLIVMNNPLFMSQLPDNKLRENLSARGIPSDTRVIVYQGMIGEDHGLLTIVKSMVSWPQNSVFALSGLVHRPEFMFKLKEQVDKLNLSQRVIYLPFLPYHKLFSYTVGAYLGVALFEAKDVSQFFVTGATNKIYEYLAMGVPVITNEAPHFREILDPSFTYFVRPDSVNGIASAINSAFGDVESYRRKSLAAREAHLKKFNYEAQFKPILEYLHKVAYGI